MKLRHIILSLLIIGFFSLSGIGLYHSYEWVELDEHTSLKGEARTNQLYAARLFLKRMGIPASQQLMYQLPNKIDTVIVLDTDRHTLPPSKIDELLDWIEQGGHLITRLRRPDQDFLALFDLKDPDDSNGSKTDTTPDNQPDYLQTVLDIQAREHTTIALQDIPLDVKWPSAPKALEVELDFFYALDSKNPDFKATYHPTRGGDERTWLLQRTQGSGLITFAAHLDFMDNTQLHKADHAELLWYMVNQSAQPIQQVWLINRDEYPTLMQLLLEYAWPILLMLVILMLSTFWALIPRFGPIIAPPPLERRRLLEHIHASGLFLWKHPSSKQQQLVKAVRQSITASMTQAMHQPNSATMTEIMQRIQWPEQQEAKLKHLLTAATLTHVEFIHLLQIAHRLRNTK